MQNVKLRVHLLDMQAKNACQVYMKSNPSTLISVLVQWPEAHTALTRRQAMNDHVSSSQHRLLKHTDIVTQQHLRLWCTIYLVASMNHCCGSSVLGK